MVRPSLDKTGLAVEVYDRLANALISGELPPGTRLKIRDLADQMGVSVTPVRDAVLRLVNNGGLLFQSPRDIRVPLLERSRYIEIRAIRLELEGLAAERAAQFATTQDILLLEGLLRDNETALAAGDHLQGLRMNQRFHFALPEIGGMMILRGLLENLWLQMGPLISSGYRDGGRVMIEHHYSVVEAIRNANGPAARAAIREDILAGGEVLLLRGALASASNGNHSGGGTGKGSVAGFSTR
ncbi:GntR family transcriptional regulator [Aquamicrobium sp. LC103]|uniref:GntR family transcriptional regulator n=1 Tax=Aquamicrobium sp. LC103 TaxID=1120658 RepID=UPI00063EBBEF|nr:GntR family transcriptional regulator [Aquamicrobium sp. LC103]